MHVTTARLKIRDLQIGDKPGLIEVWTDPVVARFMGDYGPRNPAEVGTWLIAVIKGEATAERQSHNCAILRRDNETVVGWIGVGASDDDLADWDFGYAVHPAWRGHGYATEALTAVLRFCFEDVRLRSVWGQCAPDNAASAQVMINSGLQNMGTSSAGQLQFRITA